MAQTPLNPCIFKEIVFLPRLQGLIIGCYYLVVKMYLHLFFNLFFMLTPLFAWKSFAFDSFTTEHLFASILIIIWRCALSAQIILQPLQPFFCLQLIIVFITAKAPSTINVARVIKTDTPHKHLEPSDNSNEAGLLWASSQINEAAFPPAQDEAHLLLLEVKCANIYCLLEEACPDLRMMRLQLCCRDDGGWW